MGNFMLRRDSGEVFARLRIPIFQTQPERLAGGLHA